MRRGSEYCWAFIGFLVLGGAARGQGYSPAEAPGRMTVPPGFVVELVAAEPLVRQPVAIEFDDQGRLWVLQYLQYPNPAGLKRVKVDRYSRTQYDHVPPPPPRGPPGADRVTILVDSDGDGRPESAKDFVSGLNLVSGIAFGRGGVFLLQVPYLLFYPDRDRDDSPDSDPEVLLEGFGMEDAHSVANSLTWGPDGWLYGCQGSTVTSRIRGIEFQQGVWRYHPHSREFELFCEGGGNSWGLDFDKHGNLFYSTNNGPFCMLHGVQGGYYWKSFGKHGALHNPHTYGYFDHVLHEGFRGGHVTVGGVIYQGTGFPPQIRGKYIGANLLAHDVYWHDLLPHGSTFHSRHGGELLRSNDTWFAPSDVTIGPDGAIYVSDWHDARTAHPDPDAEWDRSNGRIYRIRHASAKDVPLPDLAKLASVELLNQIGDDNEWRARRARRILADRREGEVTDALKRTLKSTPPPPYPLQVLWALAGAGGLDESTALALLDYPDEDVRWWTVRLLGDPRDVSAPAGARLAQLAKSDKSVRVRSQLASTAKRLPAAVGLPIVAALAERSEDDADEHLPLLLWWAVEDKAISARALVLELFGTGRPWGTPASRAAILPRLARRYAAEGTHDGFAACALLLENAADQAEKERIASSLSAGLQGRRRSETPAPLVPLVRSLLANPDSDPDAVRLAARLGSIAALDRSLSAARDGNLPIETRRAHLATMGELAGAAHAAGVLALADPGQPEAIQLAALDALGSASEVSIAEELLCRYAASSPAVRDKIRDLLARRATWAALLVDQVERGAIAKDDVPLEQVRRLAEWNDPAVAPRVARIWGSIKAGTPEERLAEVRRLNNDLRAASGDPTRGREVYRKKCATCHRLFGEGNAVGPELTTANRKDRDYLLVSLVDPSGVIRKEFMAHTVLTTDGRVMTGLIVEQTALSVTLVDAKNERTTFATADIAELKESPVSLMPEALYKELSPAELRDLFGYLMSDGPTARR